MNQDPQRRRRRGPFPAALQADTHLCRTTGPETQEGACPSSAVASLRSLTHHLPVLPQHRSGKRGDTTCTSAELQGSQETTHAKTSGLGVAGEDKGQSRPLPLACAQPKSLRWRVGQAQPEAPGRGPGLDTDPGSTASEGTRLFRHPAPAPNRGATRAQRQQGLVTLG